MKWLADHRFGVLLVLIVVGLTAMTVVLILAPTLSLVLVDSRLDLVINTVATLTAAAVAGLAWIHFREARRSASLFQSSAFMVLATINAVFVGFAVLRLDVPFGTSLSDPRQGLVYVWTVARIAVAALLVVGALSASRWTPGRYRGLAILLTPTLAVLAMFVVVLPFQDHLPPLLAPEALMRLQSDPRVPTYLPGVTLAGLLLQGVGGALFLTGAALYYRLYRQDRAPSTAYLAVGLIVAAFSQLHFALYPAAYTSLVTTGDALRVAFYSLLLLGALAAARADVRALELANADLGRLRDAEVAAAGLEERARLAREVHDGLAQDLFFAKLKQARLAQIPNLSRSARLLAAELGSAIESALAEARQVVMTMRVEPTPSDNSFAEVLERFVDDFSDRVGVRAEFTTEGELPPLSARVQAELLRIVQEALNNIAKHADATVVRVVASGDDSRLRVAIADNGRGFDPVRLNGGGYGLQSMRDRAARIGARLHVDSRPLDGTRVAAEIAVADLPPA